MARRFGVRTGARVRAAVSRGAAAFAVAFPAVAFPAAAFLTTVFPAVVCFVALAVAPGMAWGRSEVEVGYTREQTFSAALRYLRVDLAYEVTEKDPDAAYLLFSFVDPELSKKTGRGSIEVVQRQRSVRVLVNLPDLPSYREELLKRGLLDKLRSEYGEPVAEPPPEKPPAKKPESDSKEPPPDAPKENDPAD